MSTQFHAGINEGGRVSSKVLKPPGGGSSDIFGLGNSYNATNKPSSEKLSKSDSSTHDRVFGSNSSSPPAEVKSNGIQPSIVENGNQAPPKQKKVYVRRNPITGEEVEICLETENDDKNVCDNKEVKGEETANVPNKPVQTSIRVRNPPGGKSSGIF